MCSSRSDGKKILTLSKITHLSFWTDRSVLSGETVEWNYSGAKTNANDGKMAQVSITAPDGTKSKTSSGSSGKAGENTTSQIYTFVDAGRYVCILDDNPNVNGTIISVVRAK